MHQSKLETSVAVLKLLALQDQLSLEEIIGYLKMEPRRAKEYIKFLCNEQLIEEYREGHLQQYYVLTTRGLRVLKFFEPAYNELKKKI